MAYFGANFSVLDKLLKTPLLLKGRCIAFAAPLGNLEKPLRQELTQAGGRVLPPGNPIDVEKTCILVIDISSIKGICPERLFSYEA